MNLNETLDIVLKTRVSGLLTPKNKPKVKDREIIYFCKNYSW